MDIYGTDLFGNTIQPQGIGSLAKEFMTEPFSEINTRKGYWQDRKRAWERLGIESELGREGAKTFNTASMDEDIFGKQQTNTSIFDPALTELLYEWFCKPSGQIVDPFAGGSVRGLVAGLKGFSYYGIDLRQEQTIANEQQKSQIAPDANITWMTGDALDLLDDAPEADLIMTCPPYGDLEQYSDDPRDLSNMEYHTFIAAYSRILLKCVKKLKDSCFLCLVVGDFRDKKTGYYRGFVADTIKIVQSLGLGLYNEAILLGSIGTARLRTKQFVASKKLVKTHQNILIFLKGTPPRWDITT